MRRIAFWTGVAVAAAGCTPAPITRPRILSVQTPAGMPPPPSLKTTRTTPLIVPTAPVGTRAAVVAPAPAPVACPAPPPGVIAPPAGAIAVPAAPGSPIGVQGVAPPNTIAPPPLQYTPGPATTGTVVTPTMKPAPLPGPVPDSSETSKSDDR